MRGFWLWMIFAVGCSSTIPVGGSGDAGQGSSAADSGSDAGGQGVEKEKLSDAAASSPYLKKCTEACAPPDGPCGNQDVNACINKCTAHVDGLPVRCGQCLVENSAYTGVECIELGKPEKRSFGNRPGISGEECSGPSGSPPPTCETCPDMCPCTAADEICDGFIMAKSSGETCAASCD
jgi:hypothetical protein